MVIENVAGVSLASGRPSQEQGNLPISNGLLGEIVIDDQGVLAVISEVLTDGAAGVGSQELKRGSL